MGRLRRLLLVILIGFISSYSAVFGQAWQESMKNPNANFYSIQKVFNQDVEKQETENKLKRQQSSNEELEEEKSDEKKNEAENEEEENIIPGYLQFKRWEDFMSPRVYPSGDLTVPAKAMQTHYQNYLNSKSQKLAGAGNWTLVGDPAGMPDGAGRLSCVRWMPNDTSIIFVGAATGGLWKSTNGGISWTTNTDQLASLGINDIAIDPLNTNNMYIATGDRDWSHTLPTGVLKSVDGGATWGTCGLNNTWWTVNRLLINPINPKTIFAAVSYSGIYKSTDAGVTWANMQSGNYNDLEFRPGDTTTIYATGQTMVKSTDGGTTFIQLSNGFGTDITRMAFAVTPADPNYIYVVIASASTNGLEGVYQSTDTGFSFTKVTDAATNLLGYSTSQSGGQSNYDLSIGVSPLDKNVIYVGGVNLYKSTDAGTTWTMKGFWAGAGFHGDQHDIRFPVPTNDNIVFACTDGGLHKSTNGGNQWNFMNSGLQIGQIYKMGLSASNPNLIVIGRQDNGSHRLENTQWKYMQGGDGMDCFVDQSRDSTLYCSSQFGMHYRSDNGGQNWNWINGITESAPFVAPFAQDPIDPKTIYSGRNGNIWKSIDQGNTWAPIGTIPNTSGTRDFAIAPTDPNYIYVIKYSEIYRTTDGGLTWNNITGTLPVSLVLPSDIAVNTTDPQKIYLTFSGYNATERVYYSADAGTNWTNITSTGLSYLPINCIVYQQGTNEGIYIGTDAGIYYHDNSITGWIPFSSGLPNVIISELEIFYPTGKLRAATYGRGVWESDLYTLPVKPVSQFNADRTTICSGTSVQFLDKSTGWPSSWTWNFPGGSPSTSSAQNPTVLYSSKGIYNVSLSVKNIIGKDSVLQSAYLTVDTCLTTSILGDKSEEREFQIFPNPVTGIATIQFDLQQQQNIKLELFDMLGQQIKVFRRENIPSGKFNEAIDLSGVPDGVYFLRLNNASKKMIVQH